MSANEKTLPRVSVIVPTWNRPRDLPRCLAALAALDYPAERYEIVVVDDGSDPPAARIPAAARPDVALRWIVQRNAGPAAARNAGAKAASGELLAFTDDDCTPARGWMRALVAAHAASPDALLGGCVENAVAGNACSVASQTILDVILPHLFEAGSALRFATSNNLAAAAAAFRAIGGFDESFRTAEDRELCHRWIASGRPLLRVPEAVVLHHNALTLPAFWRQHFGYGRGAWRFHASRATDRRSLLREEVLLFTKAVRRPFAAKDPARALPVASLLVLWQVANLSGFAWQALRELGRAPR